MIGITQQMAQADRVVTLGRGSSDEPLVHGVYWVQVIKHREGNPSRHEFLSLVEALDYVREFLK